MTLYSSLIASFFETRCHVTQVGRVLAMYPRMTSCLCLWSRITAVDTTVHLLSAGNCALSLVHVKQALNQLSYMLSTIIASYFYNKNSYYNTWPHPYIKKKKKFQH